ncbi:alpha-ketoglutarate dehydrogenase component 4 [Brevipalpus obovatus]|uniref:alpha-ketoglutarate dehydrogenase component 4 n=1 Tax=Brevipalpus obovatus TaxID=246614 RepID=UPI003D9FB111
MSQNLQSAIRAVKPHIPLIRFRKGDLSKVSGKQSAPAIGSKLSASSNVLADDRLLPPIYRRKPLSGLEMEMIERGGQDF